MQSKTAVAPRQPFFFSGNAHYAAFRMITWPDGKAFAWTLFDDTDYASVERLEPIYRLLDELGLRVTKSVWPLAGPGIPVCGGATCDDAGYLDWIRTLQSDGFEIGYHGATYHSSERELTRRSLERFAELFGQTPRCMANHSSNRENIYWGASRLSSWRRTAYRLLTREWSNRFSGEQQNSPLFWGDICRQQITYVRNFVFPDLNTLAACPEMPYHDADRPYVNWWFASSEGADADSFVRTMSERNQERLYEQRGASIIYTHLACGFVEQGKVRPDVERLLRRLAALNGWFVPVGQLLDFLRNQNSGHQLTAAERARLERKWLWHKIRSGRS